MTKATLILVFNDQLEAAMAFYTATFTDFRIRNVARNGMEAMMTMVKLDVSALERAYVEAWR
ncbi:MAG TPA: VOC family protein [Aquabacterium sp.]|nr:VOC family protein [Aquabacterium sp.]